MSKLWKPKLCIQINMDHLDPDPEDIYRQIDLENEAECTAEVTRLRKKLRGYKIRLQNKQNGKGFHMKQPELLDDAHEDGKQVILYSFMA